MSLLLRRIPFIFGISLLLAPLAAEDKARLTADEILSRAIERAEKAARDNPDGRLHFEYLSVSHELNDQQEVKKEETKLYRNVPMEGIAFQRLVKKDGQPLEGGDLEDERDREEKFREKIASGKDPRKEKENRMEFDEGLTGRYHFKLDGPETVDGFDCWVLSFRPREGDLPNENRMDPALNNSIGKLWITQDQFEIARAEFELTDPVRMWWGIIGKIAKLNGRIDRRPVKDGLWMPQRFDLYMKGRIFFSGLHRRQQVEWSSFEYVQPGEAAAEEPAESPFAR